MMLAWFCYLDACLSPPADYTFLKASDSNKVPSTSHSAFFFPVVDMINMRLLTELLRGKVNKDITEVK